MVTRLIGVLFVVWTATTALAASDSVPSTTPTPEGTAPDQTRQAGPNQPPPEDDELIRNLDMIEHLDLLDTLEVLGTLKSPESPEEEF
jgi:hypothetical protein